MEHDKKLIEKIALEVQAEYQMGGLANGIYLDFATDVAIRYANAVSAALAVVLSKYIQYIRDVDGTDYILIHDERYASDVKFTDEEWQLLTDVAKNCG